MRMFKKEEGFTLVELMVVVLIIGILVAVAVPVFNAASDNARKKSCFSNQRTIDGAVQQWLAENEDQTDADLMLAGIDVLYGPDAFIATEPTCPSGGDAYALEDGDASATAVKAQVAACSLAEHGRYQ